MRIGFFAGQTRCERMRPLSGNYDDIVGFVRLAATVIGVQAQTPSAGHRSARYRLPPGVRSRAAHRVLSDGNCRRRSGGRARRANLGPIGCLRRASASVSVTTSLVIAGRPSRANSAFMKPMSKVALCATHRASPKKASSSSTMPAKFGLSFRDSSEMPWIAKASGCTLRSPGLI